MKRLLAFALLVLCGCGDSLSSWEYQAVFPYGALPESMTELENVLRGKGFVRFRTRIKFDTFGDPRCVVFYATRTPEKEDRK